MQNKKHHGSPGNHHRLLENLCSNEVENFEK
jgi:hypothetical protein